MAVLKISGFTFKRLKKIAGLLGTSDGTPCADGTIEANISDETMTRLLKFDPDPEVAVMRLLSIAEKKS